jgi:hypothetical protein
MRQYYAVEILPSDDHHWVEVEITDNLTTANRFYLAYVYTLDSSAYLKLNK